MKRMRCERSARHGESDHRVGHRRRAPAPGRPAVGDGGRRPHRADQALQGALAALLLRRAGLGAVRADHRAARVLPDPRRAGDPREQRRRDRRRGRQPGDADRARLGLGGEDAGSCSTRCATRAGSRPTRRSTSPRRSPATRRPRSPRSTGSRVHGLVCDFELDLERIPLEGPRVIALLGGTIGNFEPQQRASFLRPGRQPARARRPLPAGDRPDQGPGDARGRLQRLGRGHRRVQQERARGAQRQARRRLRPRRLRALRLLGRREPLRRHPAALAAAPVGRVRGARDDASPSSAARRCGPRSRPSSRARAWRGSTPRPGSSWPTGGPTPTSCSGSRWPARQPLGRVNPRSHCGASRSISSAWRSGVVIGVRIGRVIPPAT